MTSSKHDLGFVGAGTMARALARGIRAADLAGTITVYDPDPECLRSFCAEVDAIGVRDNGSVALAAPILFLAVKPQDMENATSTLAMGDGSLADKLVVSIAAGVTLDRLSSWLPDARLIRVMPNTPCLVSEMAAGFSLGATATDRDSTIVGDLLGALGVALEVKEEHLDAVTALSGSGPAFFAGLLQAFIDAGQFCGLPIEVARELTLQTAKGTAVLLQERGWEPMQLIEMVSSPGGTTVAGRGVLESSDIPEVIANTIKAATARGQELAGS